jgi:hypothetical protein
MLVGESRNFLTRRRSMSSEGMFIAAVQVRPTSTASSADTVFGVRPAAHFETHMMFYVSKYQLIYQNID